MNRRTLSFPIDRHIGPNGIAEVQYAAAHEAGHIVIARCFGIRGGNVRVYDTEHGVAGFAKTAHFEDMQDIWAGRGKFRTREAAIRAAIIIAAAGPEAEWRLYGWLCGDEGDCKAIDNLLTLLPERARMEKRLRAFAKQLVYRHRVAIGLVSLGLTERLELSSEQIDEWLNDPARAIGLLIAERGMPRVRRAYTPWWQRSLRLKA